VGDGSVKDVLWYAGGFGGVGGGGGGVNGGGGRLGAQSLWWCCRLGADVLSFVCRCCGRLLCQVLLVVGVTSVWGFRSEISGVCALDRGWPMLWGEGGESDPSFFGYVWSGCTCVWSVNAVPYSRAVRVLASF